jgi:hypothetical protein
MRRAGRWAVLGYLAMLILGNVVVVGGAWAFPCKGDVNTGDTPKAVSESCGEPMLVEKRTVSVKETEGKETRSSLTNIEEWTYTAGPTQLMQSFRFENGKLIDIGSPGYGPVQDFSIDNCRNGEFLAVGDSKLDAFMKCGHPLAQETQPDKVTVTAEGEIKRRTTVSVDEWTYRYGPGAPGYTLRFENGVVASIRPREFGK